MAKFIFIEWLVLFLSSQDFFIFEWDQGNSKKNKDKHGIEIDEVESAFLDPSIMVLGKQFQPPVLNEERYGVIAKSQTKKVLFICFTIREGKIRAISARLANKKEVSIYEN